MVDPLSFTSYDLALGVVTAVGVLAVLAGRSTVEYHRSLLVTVGGLLVFLVGGPLATLLAPALVHWIHGVAALLVVLGLSDAVERDLRGDAWPAALLRDPGQLRQPADWMLPVDDAVLALFRDADLVLTPSVVAYNIDYSREEVNRRLVELAERGYVTRVERGKYRIAPLGRQYLEGSVSRSGWSRLERLRHAATDA